MMKSPVSSSFVLDPRLIPYMILDIPMLTREKGHAVLGRRGRIIPIISFTASAPSVQQVLCFVLTS